ncbi:hypothetical protein CHS0354_026809 [Potamilus streckersoni]|uniref:Hypoxanthine phosphoribosyltransferase n=1 Tax=Potamilus streckersoni TaxID=2493646 RepID=A0AAE0T542_9BIVA|nr:hypothetical protein CHS0354_026809 [Potamilus streckersoni]
MTANAKLTPYIKAAEIQTRIKELAKEIDAYYAGKEIIAIFLLNGAIFFGVDLVRQMKTPMKIDTLSASSYSGTESTGVIKINSDLKINITGKHALIVEDIVDTGLTLKSIVNFVGQKKPADLKIVCLLDKYERRVVDNLTVDYTGFKIEDNFVVGYGFDYNENFRTLDQIYIYGGEG